MVALMRRHGLVPVPVDLDLATLAPSADDVRAAVARHGDDVAAVYVAHVFGAEVYMAPIARLARARGLLLWEDCAQVFRGLDASPAIAAPVAPAKNGGGAGDGRTLLAADASFFSFGLIKRATALGGAVALLTDAGLAERMRRARQALPVESAGDFARRLAKAFFMLAASNTLLYGIAIRAVRLAGVDHDAFISRMGRAFPVRPRRGSGSSSSNDGCGAGASSALESGGAAGDGSNGSSRSDGSGGGCNGERSGEEEFVRRIRRRPCLAMLRLLRRRLASYSEAGLEPRYLQAARCDALVHVYAADGDRFTGCHRSNCDGNREKMNNGPAAVGRTATATVAEVDVDAADESRNVFWVPGAAARVHSHWVYPVVVGGGPAAADRVVAALLLRGFDATRAPSALAVVADVCSAVAPMPVAATAPEATGKSHGSSNDSDKAGAVGEDAFAAALSPGVPRATPRCRALLASLVYLPLADGMPRDVLAAMVATAAAAAAAAEKVDAGSVNAT
ncbi:unnamed protein product [Phaeothamnion confervicola]